MLIFVPRIFQPSVFLPGLGPTIRGSKAGESIRVRVLIFPNSLDGQYGNAYTRYHVCSMVSTGLDEADSHLRRPKSPQLDGYDTGRWRPCLSPDRCPEHSFGILFSPLHFSVVMTLDGNPPGPWRTLAGRSRPYCANGQLSCSALHRDVRSR